jgi:uroporphyrinogen decarboxylase
LNDVLLRALKGEDVPYAPVWFMRQAGRALPEYRELKGDRSVLDAALDPSVAAAITELPVSRLGVDAAILFSDILVPVHLGMRGVAIVEGRGPVVESPIRAPSDLSRLGIPSREALSPVEEAARIVSSRLAVPLIGLCGGPFTLACYVVEGTTSKDWVATRTLFKKDKGMARELLAALSEASLAFAAAQARGGARVIQVFDSWVGVLAAGDFEEVVASSLERLISSIRNLGCHVIYFSMASCHLLRHLGQLGADAISLDWRVDLSQLPPYLLSTTAIQGNLDPAACLLNLPELEREADKVLRSASSIPRFIFNLGHGVLPETPPENLSALVEFVHSRTRHG